MHYLLSSQLRRLAGGKKRRCRDESLYNVVDVSEGEVQESIKAYQKYHTEDSVNKLYQPSVSLAPTAVSWTNRHSSNDNNVPAPCPSPQGQAPGFMQKRKHQLTYLAYQAKANELELRKHWGQAYQTKRQSRMKYGF